MAQRPPGLASLSTAQDQAPAQQHTEAPVPVVQPPHADAPVPVARPTAIKRPMGLGPAFNTDLLRRHDDHDEFHPAPVSAAHALPVSRITDDIFVGSVLDLRDLDNLRRLGITHILNVAREVEMIGESPAVSPAASEPTPQSSASSGAASAGAGAVSGDSPAEDGDEPHRVKVPSSGFVMQHIPLKDGVNRDTAGVIDRAVDYIAEALDHRDTKVLVHCRRGISRSAAVVVAFLMETKAMTYVDAVALVKTARSCVSLNLEFRDALESKCEANRVRREQTATQEGSLRQAAMQRAQQRVGSSAFDDDAAPRTGSPARSFDGASNHSEAGSDVTPAFSTGSPQPSPQVSTFTAAALASYSNGTTGGGGGGGQQALEEDNEPPPSSTATGGSRGGASFA